MLERKEEGGDEGSGKWEGMVGATGAAIVPDAAVRSPSAAQQQLSTQNDQMVTESVRLHEVEIRGVYERRRWDGETDFGDMSKRRFGNRDLCGLNCAETLSF